jgi:DnaJ-class molecular chaperone
MLRAHISWPVCTDCEGCGVFQRNFSQERQQGWTCPTCGGTGRVKPAGWDSTTTETFVNQGMSLDDALKATAEADARQAAERTAEEDARQAAERTPSLISLTVPEP